jgi:hypothetical protein
MKLGKMLGLIGFAIGFVAPVLFYTGPGPLFQAFFVCPWCPALVIFPSSRMTWVGVGIKSGLLYGLLLALTGFAIGYAVTRLAPAK